MKKISLFVICVIASLFISCEPNITNLNSHEYVDLGLSVKWATCNIGAANPEDFGDYFAWGEVKTKDIFSVSTYKWYNGSIESITKYNNLSDFGTVDNKFILEESDDAAIVNWGGGWRMPTKEEIIELCEQCTWAWTVLNGVNGYKVVGPNGNSIFLPAAGYIGEDFRGDEDELCYWSQSMYVHNEDYYPWVAYCLYAYYSEVSPLCDGLNRDAGCPIRAVCP